VRLPNPGQAFSKSTTLKVRQLPCRPHSLLYNTTTLLGDAFLAQSPQLAKQMCIAADFERVFEIGPVFRAENSLTHRHLTEFVGLDLEMAFDEHYHEVVDVLDEMLKSVFKGLRDKYRNEVEIICQQFPADEFKWREGPEGTLKLTFAEAVDLLVADGVERSELDDIKSVDLFSLCQSLLTEHHLALRMRSGWEESSSRSMTLIISLWTSSQCTFGHSTLCQTRTIPYVFFLILCFLSHSHNQTLSNAYDFFMRGEEILSGGQRIHEPSLLIEQMKRQEIDPASMQGYLSAFKLGCPPHGGGGIGECFPVNSMV
jgi:aspartyl/asparaginyl-tRNA synthetase